MLDKKDAWWTGCSVLTTFIFLCILVVYIASNEICNISYEQNQSVVSVQKLLPVTIITEWKFILMAVSLCCVQHNHFQCHFFGKNSKILAIIYIILWFSIQYRVLHHSHMALWPTFFIFKCSYFNFKFADNKKKNSGQFTHTEPVGSVRPKISGEDFKKTKVHINDSIALLCPAQSFPVPIYR